MIEKAEETGANIQVGQVVRFCDEYVELAKTLEKFKALVDSGAITEDEYSKIKENI